MKPEILSLCLLVALFGTGFSFNVRIGVSQAPKYRRQSFRIHSNNLAEREDLPTDRPDLSDQRDELASRLNDLQALQVSIESAQNITSIDQLETSLSVIENNVDELASGLLPPPGMSREDYVKSCVYFAKLPVRVRWALCSSLEMEDGLEAATQWDKIPEIVSELYSKRKSLTPSRLEEALKSTQSYRIGSQSTPKLNEIFTEVTTTRSDNGGSGSTISNIFGEGEPEEETIKRRAESLLPRVTRKEDRGASGEDLKALMDCLGNDLFVVSANDEIDGGYIVRGVSRAKTGTELINALDERLPSEWSSQVCYLEEFTQFEGTPQDPVLLLLNKDMSPTASPAIFSLSTLAAVVTAVLFSVGVYGGNDIVTSRITDQTLLDDLSGINWFNSKVAEVLLPLLAIQISHEFGQFLLSKKNGIKTTTPWLLPCLGLPFMGAVTNLRESPKNLTALFDFAVAGPLFGLVTAMGFFVAGLQLGNLATPEMTQYYPALPVNVITISTLGGSFVDFFAGGEGFVTTQDPSEAVRLHPFAIAGFAGLVMNSLELLPIGATDGGRLSLAIFGRKGHALIGGFTWISLLFAAFFVERADAIIGAWAVYNIAQNGQLALEIMTFRGSSMVTLTLDLLFPFPFFQMPKFRVGMR